MFSHVLRAAPIFNHANVGPKERSDNRFLYFTLIALVLILISPIALHAQVPEVGHTCVSGCGGQSSTNSAEDARRARQHAAHMKRYREWEGILWQWKGAARKGAGYSLKGQKALAKGKCAEAMDAFQRELAAFQSVSADELSRADNIWGLNRCIKEGGKTHCYGDLHGAQEQRVGWARERIAGAQARCGGQTLLAGKQNGAAPTSSAKSKQHTSNSKPNSSTLSRAQVEQQKRDKRLREWTDRAGAAAARGEWHDAIRDYKKAAEASPNNPSAQQNLARAQNEYGAEAYKKRDYKNAVKYFGEAAKTSPTDATIAANLRTAEEAKSRGKGASPAATVQPTTSGLTSIAPAPSPQVNPNGTAKGSSPAVPMAQPTTGTSGQLSPFPTTGTQGGVPLLAPAPSFEVKPNGTAMQQLQAIGGATREAPAAQGVCKENCLPPKLMADAKALQAYRAKEATRAKQRADIETLQKKLDQINSDPNTRRGNPALAQQYSDISNQKTQAEYDLKKTETEMNSFLVNFQEEPAKAQGESGTKAQTKEQQQ